ncbi:hypothetical protein [uncultured Clostridium sp.]|uniref:hypothetical protein n=1 Tax=uncultured Clostridium sp. TaxID=59620 RepID=UPI0026161ACD|nr:hypothetical protein [uncultured Clostridium sp.]
MKKLSKFQKRNLKIFFLGIILAIISVIFILFSMSSNFLFNFSYHGLKNLSEDIAIACAVCFGIAVALWALRLIIRYLNPKTFDFIWGKLDKTKLKLKDSSKHNIMSFLTKPIKQLLIFLSRLIQKFHIPLAMIGFAVISIHVYIFLHLGFKWKLGYILGALDGIILIILILSGLLRIFNKGLKNHKYLGILFIIVMILHILFN